MAEGKNSIVDLKKYLGTPENPVALVEFQAFWDDCSDDEKSEFKNTELPKD